MKPLFLLIGLFVSNLLLAQVDYDRQIENFTSEISRKIDTSKHYKVGIMEFVNNDKNETQLGEIIADDISAELANLSSNSTKFEVLERSRLDQIFKEKKLIKNYDSKDATELGKINAVNILIIGTIVPFGDYYKVTIKLLDSRSGSVLSSVKGQLAKTKAIDELYYKIILTFKLKIPILKTLLSQ
jgi:TolB-like protein